MYGGLWAGISKSGTLRASPYGNILQSAQQGGHMMRKGMVGLVAAFASFAMIGCSDDASEAPLTEEELAALCGDSVCHELETAESCPSDCQSVCGDDFCTHDESPW